MKELLEKARALYPVGTRFASPCTGKVGIVIAHPSTVSGDIYVKAQVGDVQDSIYLYFNNKWAPILPAEDAIINNYQIY